MVCARQVFRCFKWLERAGDRITGAAGPYFVALAVILISLCSVSFFTVVQPGFQFPWLSTPPCILLAVNLVMHYYYVCTVPPGFVDDPPRHSGSNFMWASPSRPQRPLRTSGVRWTSPEIEIVRAHITRCKRCGQMRPERAHHCRICNKCVLKYDHHCPVRINQCVGLHNERHFVLFMAYLVLATLCFSFLGYPYALDALGMTYLPWTHPLPQLCFILSYILSVVMSRGETSVEAQDHEVYRNIAKGRGEAFINSYDMGNLALFFNVGPKGYPLYTLFFPFRIMPYSDGSSWARREGLQRHHGVREGEELTDEEDEEEP
ncbi:DHHC palmitoyltransferase-domain-containing protein [Melanogaster broomeanus]|nr:DHHC palmitoyltransferase-domain-containing protein [Melanogaster broomeanus]